MADKGWRAYQWAIWLQVEDLKEAVGGRCFTCNRRGTKANQLEFAHLEPTALSGMGRGSHHRRLDVLKHLSSYSYLCKECHHKFDKGKLQTPPSLATQLGDRVGEFKRAVTEQPSGVPF